MPFPSLELTAIGRILLLLFALYEALSAVALLGPIAWTRALAVRAYRIELPPVLDPRHEWASRMVGLHSGQVALACLLALWAGGTAEIVAMAGVLALSLGRALARWGHRGLLARAFAVSPERSLRKALFNLALVAIILALSFARS